MAGYSNTPLIKKLGIKEGDCVAIVNSPNGFHGELGQLPTGVRLIAPPKRPLDFVLLFVDKEAQLIKGFDKFAGMLAPAGMLWIAWPKKSSGVKTELSFDVVQKIGLETGLVDIKICAVNEVWSGLKFVIRKKDRGARLK